jgi:hypothetical protein
MMGQETCLGISSYGARLCQGVRNVRHAEELFREVKNDRRHPNGQCNGRNCAAKVGHILALPGVSVAVAASHNWPAALRPARHGRR